MKTLLQRWISTGSEKQSCLRLMTIICERTVLVKEVDIIEEFVPMYTSKGFKLQAITKYKQTLSLKSSSPLLFNFLYPISTVDLDGSHLVTQAGLNLFSVFLLQCSQCWDYGLQILPQVPPISYVFNPDYFYFFVVLIYNYNIS